MNTNKGVVATFTDRYGTERKVHATRHGLTVKREAQTVALKLNQQIAGMIGTNIREARIARGWSLEELCIKAGLASATPKNRMWEIENSIRKEGIRLGTLYALAAALDVEPASLLPSLETVMALAEVAPVSVEMLSAK